MSYNIMQWNGDVMEALERLICARVGRRRRFAQWQCAAATNGGRRGAVVLGVAPLTLGVVSGRARVGSGAADSQRGAGSGDRTATTWVWFSFESFLPCRETNELSEFARARETSV